jgi:6-phosphogluconolactonase (cycloisomerase 2 family)
VFAVNAGDNSVSSFKISEDGTVSLVGKYSTVGIRPTCVAQRGNLVYVLTSAGTMGAGAIEGFSFDTSTGVLSTINNSLTVLPNNSNASQVGFVYDNVIAITERTTNIISTYVLNGQNIPSNRQTISSAEPGPYGYAVGNNGNIYVAEASPSSSMSSYKVSTNGQISLIKTLSNNQGGACWSVLNLDESIVYSTNAGANTISSFNISTTGELTATQIAYNMGAGSGPVDAGMSKDGKYIYVLANGADKIYGYTVAGNTLTIISGATMFVPGAAFGLAAY